MAACAVCSSTVSASPVSVVGSSGRCQGPGPVPMPVPWLGLGRRRVPFPSLPTPWAGTNTKGETAIQRHTVAAWDSASASVSASSLGSPCSFGRSLPFLGSSSCSSSGGGGGLSSASFGDRIARGRGGVVCEVAVSVGDEQSSGEKEQEDKDKIKAGDRVRVKNPLTVYHVPKAKNLKVEGLVGEVKEVLGIYKGKPISATFPIKTQFVIDVDGKDVKFFVHLKPEECEVVEE